MKKDFFLGHVIHATNTDSFFLISETTNVNLVFLIAGGLTAIISLLPLLHPVIRKLD